MIACGVADDDALLTVRRIEVDETHVMLLSKEGKCIRFDISDVPVFGRSARGNRGMALDKHDAIIDALLVPPGIHGTDRSEDPGDDETEEISDEQSFGTTLLTVTGVWLRQAYAVRAVSTSGTIRKGYLVLSHLVDHGECGGRTRGGE